MDPVPSGLTKDVLLDPAEFNPVDKLLPVRPSTFIPFDAPLPSPVVPCPVLLNPGICGPREPDHGKDLTGGSGPKGFCVACKKNNEQ